MITIKEYVVPDTLDEAYELLTSKRNNVVLGGSGFLKLSRKNIGTAIDLKDIDLDYIDEDNENILIGADVSLRKLEQHKLIKTYCGGLISCAVSNIVGVQFRNGVRVGGSVFSKYGFSDLIPPLLAVGAKVKLYKRGIVGLEEFLKSDYEKDILIEVILKKKDAKGVYDSIRKCTGDFPVINGSIILEDGEYTVVLGARPQMAMIAKRASEVLTKENNIEKASELVKVELAYGSNLRASKEYRSDMSKALVTRMYNSIGCDKDDK